MLLSTMKWGVFLAYVSFLCHVRGWQTQTNQRRKHVAQAKISSRLVLPGVIGLKQHYSITGKKFEPLSMAADDNFWSQQRALMEQMTDRTEKSLKEEQKIKFAARRNALIEDTAFFAVLIFSFLWLICENPFVSFSYCLGAVLGLAYAYGLGKYVETIGGNAEDTEAVQGAGVGQARFAFLILLFVVVGKYRSSGLLEIPTIGGFFTYQLASLNQGLREIND